MGNALHQADQKIQKDLRVRVDPKYANSLYQSSSESVRNSELQHESKHFWDKLFTRKGGDKQMKEEMLEQSRKNFKRKNKKQKETLPNPNTPNQYHCINLRQDETQLPKQIFSSQLSNHQPSIKFHWKKLTPSSSTILKKSFPHIHFLLMKEKQIYFTQLNTTTVSFFGGEEILLAEKIVVDEDEMAEGLMWDEWGRDGKNENLQYEEKLERVKNINSLIYEWRVYVSRMALRRSDNQFPIVGIYEVSHSSLNLSFRPKTTLFQQLIPYRLKNVRHLTHLQGIYVLEQCLIGFKLLYDIFGYFYIEQKMVGFNASGRVKVWISSLFWSNLCYSVKNRGVDGKDERQMEEMRKYEEEDMVDKIWMIIQKYALFHSSIVIENGGFKRCNFRQALDLIVRHKSFIIHRRDRSLGLIEFVKGLEFEDNQIRSQEIENLLTNKLAKNYSEMISRQDSKPRPYPSIVTQQAHNQNHIKIIPNSFSPFKRRRALIFDKEYTNKMSHNMSKSKFQGDTKQKYSSSWDKYQNQTDQMKFINIRSLK